MEELLSHCPRWVLPGRGRPALCAVSGGLDSMCLLDLLDRWCRERDGRVVAAHFNHRLRGAEADRDETFVRDWCAAHDIAFVSSSGDVRGLMEREGLSLEMSREQLATRLLASEALVENNRLKTGALRETDWEKIAGAATILNKVDIRIDDNPMLSVADMNAKCRRLDDLGLVVIDYLQLMTSAGGKGYAGENRQQVVSDISRMLKIMAKELNVPVICLSQLSRASEKRDDKRPMLSDLRESGAIEQDADIVLFLYRDDYYNEDSEKHNIAECIVAKNRHGETGKVELRWMPEYTQFSTLDTRYDED